MMEEMSLSRAFSENFDCLVSYDSLEVTTNPRHHRCGQPLVTIFFYAAKFVASGSGSGDQELELELELERSRYAVAGMFSMCCSHCIQYIVSILIY